MDMNTKGKVRPPPPDLYSDGSSNENEMRKSKESIRDSISDTDSRHSLFDLSGQPSSSDSKRDSN